MPSGDAERPTVSVRVALAVTLLSGAVFVVLAALLVPWSWLPGGHVEAVPATSVFTSQEIARGEHVSGLLRHNGWANLAAGLVVAVVLGFTRLGPALMSRLRGPWAMRVVLGAGLVSAIGVLLTLPFAWRAQRIQLDERLSTQSWSGWASDELVSFAVSWAFTAIGLLVVMWIARRAPRTWPAWAAAGAALLAFAGSYVYPVVVEPLFNDFTPMAAGPLRSDILALAEREHVHVSDVLVADASRRTTTFNAYVSGIGNTRRIVVYDTLLTGLPPAEVEVVVAHELGHARHQDVLAGTLLGAAGSAFGIGLLGLVFSRRRVLDLVGGPGDVRAVPLLLALVAVGALLASPVQNTISRAVEARADRASLEATGATDTFIAMQRQLALRSLADPTPPRWSQFWFGSHPTVLQRIGLAQAMARD
ncbi:M48 family metallopeptidase [Marmoricola sp. RAF53]|uniref:M48 family metallopeptidase n=1 Tax=Marmoricola sp. RAF53 TaxID=3233059 RepID=UPI003F9AAF58